MKTSTILINDRKKEHRNFASQLLGSFTLALLLLLGTATTAGWVLAQDNAKGQDDQRRGDDRSIRRRTGDDYVPLTAPLPVDDPRARLNPEFLHYKPARVPHYTWGLSTSQSDSRVMEYDLETGATQENQLEPRVLANEMDVITAMPGGIGSVPLIDGSDLGRKGLEEGAKLESLPCCGTDDRRLITDTQAFPWRTMTKLFMNFGNGVEAVCSGTLISPKHVITAGHCIYSSSEGGFARRVTVIPGLNGTYQPYGQAQAVLLRTFSAYVQSGGSDFNHDMALITLDRPIGNTTGWLGYAAYDQVLGITANVAGYPGDRDGGYRMYWHAGPVLAATTTQIAYTLDTAGGQSGSGVYRVSNQQRFVFAVHTFGIPNEYNGGCRLNTDKFNAVRSWIASDR